MQGVEALTVQCHSERSASEVKNLKQIARDSSLTLRNDTIVILRGKTPKNLLPSVTASQYNVILKGFALKNPSTKSNFA